MNFIEAIFQGPLQQKASSDCVLCHRLHARSGSYECSPGVPEPQCLALFCCPIPDWPALSVACTIAVLPGILGMASQEIAIPPVCGSC